MKEQVSKNARRREETRELFDDFRALSHRILQCGSRGTGRADFLRRVVEILVDFSRSDAAEIRLKERQKFYRCRFGRADRSFRFTTLPLTGDGEEGVLCSVDTDPGLERVCRAVLGRHCDPSVPFFTKGGSFWTGDSQGVFDIGSAAREPSDEDQIRIAGSSRSLVVTPVVVGDDIVGLLYLASDRRDYFSLANVEFYEAIAQSLGVALAYRRAQVALRERVKELTCLYGISRLVERPGILLDDILQGVAELLPRGWLYPEIASARVVLDGRSYSMTEFPEDGQRQSGEVIVAGQHRGTVEVAYREERPELDEGPFLEEERHLIDTVAREVALIVERKQAEEDKSRLEQQLRHADRLATIGQLAAGVAHELNEPLGNILGFAQLAEKTQGLPKQAKKDIGKVVSGSLHARGVIQKLVLFAREVPPKKTRVNLNQVVEEGILFFEARCEKAGIELVRLLSPDLPEVTADSSQLNQVLVNLVVNSIHAMPAGGRLTVQTLVSGDRVFLIVEDTGVGMSDEVKRQIFLPFFTTKDIDEGTGLGLPVVHGIVSSHGGSVRVDSEVGRGTRFEIQLPLGGNEDVKEGDLNVTSG